MADTNLSIKDATGAAVPIDTQTPSGGERRQVVVLGDPNTISGVATVGSNGALTVASVAPTASAVNPVASTTTNGTTLQAANASRAGLYIYNDSTAILYVKLGTGATPTDWSLKVKPDGFYELPPPYYRGAVSGVWAAANGFARVTEVS
jgi:hypothetical protein